MSRRATTQRLHLRKHARPGEHGVHSALHRLFSSLQHLATILGGTLLLATPQALAQSVTLSHGFPTVKTATLTISGHTAAWWHKSDQTNATCVSVAANTPSANLTNLTGGTTYVWKVYSDSSCSTELASTTFTTIAVTIDQITATTARLNLAHNTNRTWSYKQTLPSSPDCQQDGLWGFDPNDSPQSLTNLSPNTSYTFTVYWGSDCAQANEGEAVTFTTSAATLAVSNITKTSATLTISGHSNIAWWYQGNQSGATCTSIAANTLTADLTDLTVGTEYTYKAYNASGCDAANEIASRTFTTEAGKPGAPSNLSSSKTASYHIPTSRWRIKVRMSWTSGANNGTAITSTTVRYRRTNPVGSWWTDSGPSRTEWTPTFWSNVSDRWGKAMEFQVRETNSKGAGTWSASSAFTVAVAPAKPTAPSVTPGYQQLGLSWTAPDGRGAAVTGYDVQYRPGSSGPWTDHTHSGTGTTATVTGLNDIAAYQVRVRAANSQGDSEWSDTATGTPSPPDPVTAVTVVHNGSSLDVTWPAAARADSYHVTYTDDNGTSWQLAALEHTGTSLTINGVDGTKSYLVGVRAKNAAGYSGWTNSSAATFAVPDPVASVTVVHNGSSLTVTWPAVDRANSYHVTYTDDNATSWQLGALEYAGTSLTINGVDSSKLYLAAVRAKNAGGYSDWTNSSAAEAGMPDPVASVTVVHNGSSLTVTWPAAARANSYHVTYTDNNATSWQLAALEHTGTDLTINGLDGTKSYIVAVRAKNGAGYYSHWTNSSAATFAVPDPVASVTAVHKGSSLDVSWPAAARADSYHVTYTGDNGTSWQLAALEHTGTSLTINNVDSSKTYLVGVRAKNAAGYSGWVNSDPAAPPALSVTNATTAEPDAGESTTLDFVVTLNRAASATVTVDYATSDGTATAGADYTAASGTLSFAVGETSKTVSVSVLDDSHNEGSETLTLTLSNATGAVIADGEATGTITTADPMPQAWISRFGRTVADQVLDAVASRLRSTPTPGLEVTLAGERLGWSTDTDAGQPVAEQAVEQLAQWLVVGNGESGDVALRTIEGRELVANSSFAFASPSSGGSLFSFWGRGAVTNFDGREGELTLDGEVTTWMLATDWSWGQWPGSEARRSTAGLLLSRSTADGGYAGTGRGTGSGSSGDVETTLTGVFPWTRHRFTDRLEVWGTAGYGQGELQVTPKRSTGEDDATLTADLNLWMAAGGLRGTLLDGGNDGLTLTGKTDAMAVWTTSEQVTGLEAAQATVTRLRLGVEAQRPIPLGNPDSGTEEGSGAVLTPSLEMGLRHDGGDAETGFGLDLGGGIVLSHPQRGLQAEVRGRGLLTHAAEGFRDRGFSGSLSWQQQPDSDLGAALSLTQTMGGSSSSGTDALLSRVTLEGLAASDTSDNDDLNQRLELQFRYGFPTFGDRFTLTPELGVGLYDSGRDYRIGWSLTRPDDGESGESFAFSFDVTRREGANTAPDHGVQLEVNTRF